MSSCERGMWRDCRYRFCRRVNAPSNPIAAWRRGGCWKRQKWSTAEETRSILRQRTLDDVAHVGRKRRRGGYAPQRRLRQSSPSRFQHAPALERGKKPRRQLRIFGVERQHNINDELVARAVGTVELFLVAKREGMDQGAHA